MIIIKSILTLVAISFVGGCAGSLARNVSDPGRKNFTIDGLSVAVVPQPDHWSAWYVSSKFIEAIPALPLIKRAEIKAIEQYSGCKVISSDFVEGSLQPAYLQAIVDCK